MALTTQKTKIRYRGNGVTTYFPIPFPVLSAAHVQVFTPGVGGVSEVMTSGFDVMEEGARSYAVVFYEPLPSGQEITIARILELEQNLDLENGGNFSTEEIETTFDVVVMLIQQLAEILERCVKTGIVAEESGLSVEEIYAQLEEIVAKAEQALEDIKNIQEPVILAKGITNLRGTWTTKEALPTGSVLRMPVGYFPGREMLLLMMDGFTCYPVNEYETANIQQYEEMGSEDEISRDVKLLFDAPAGAIWSAWAIASNVSQHQEDLLALTEEARDRAEAAADKAESIQGNVDVTIGNAAEIAAEQAAVLAIKKAEKLLAELVEAAQSAKVIVEAARDEAVSAATSTAGDVQTVIDQVAQAQASVSEMQRLVTEAGSFVEVVALARDEAVTAAGNAAKDATQAVEGRLTAYLDEAKGILESAKVTVTGDVLHSLSGTRAETVQAGSKFTVPAFVVGSGALQVYFDGLYCMAGEDKEIYQYREAGEVGQISTAIIWHDDIAPVHDITAHVISGQREAE